MRCPICLNHHDGIPFVDCPKGSTQDLHKTAEYITNLNTNMRRVRLLLDYSGKQSIGEAKAILDHILNGEP